MALCQSPIEERQLEDMIQRKEGPESSLGLASCPYCRRPMSDECGEESHALQRDDARFKAVWSKEMGDVGQGSVYRTVSVLLISWDDEAGDLRTGEEVLIYTCYDNEMTT
jgi:hypothetical protein